MFGRKAKRIAQLESYNAVLIKDLDAVQRQLNSCGAKYRTQQSVTIAAVAALPTFYGSRYYNASQVDETIAAFNKTVAV